MGFAQNGGNKEERKIGFQVAEDISFIKKQCCGNEKLSDKLHCKMRKKRKARI